MTGSSAKHHKHACITPYFTLDNADLFITFATAVFDAQLVRENRYENGTIQHARLTIGDSLLMLNQSNENYPANTSQMHVYVDDVHQTFGAAMQAGGIPIMEPNTRPHGDLMAGFKDPCNNIWWIATTQD